MSATKRWPTPPRGLSDNEMAVWYEEAGAKPRSVVLGLSWARFELEAASQRIALLEGTLREAREWLEHQPGHGDDCNGCSVEAEVDDVLAQTTKTAPTFGTALAPSRQP